MFGKGKNLVSVANVARTFRLGHVTERNLISELYSGGRGSERSYMEATVFTVLVCPFLENPVVMVLKLFSRKQARHTGVP